MKTKANQTWTNRFIFFLKVLLGAGLILLLFLSGRLDFSGVINAYKYPVFLVAGALCCTFAIITPIFRWWILALIQKLPLGAFDALRLTMIGYFFNIFIPSGSGGDVVRAAYVLRDCPERRAQALTIAFVDRGLGLHALFLLGSSLIFIQPTLFINFPYLKPWLLFLGGMLIIGTVLPLMLVCTRTNVFILRICGRIIGGMDAWQEAMMLYRQQPGMLSFAYLLSIGSAVFNVLTIHFMMLAIGSTPSVFESLFVAPLVILANTLPFTPGGVGVAEGASAGLYALVYQGGGANGMLLTRLFIVFHAFLGLAFFLQSKNQLN